MGLYRRKPPEIEAFQVLQENVTEINRWLTALNSGRTLVRSQSGVYTIISSLGNSIVLEKDYITFDALGIFKIVGKVLFREKYERSIDPERVYYGDPR